MLTPAESQACLPYSLDISFGTTARIFVAVCDRKIKFSRYSLIYLCNRQFSRTSNTKITMLRNSRTGGTLEALNVQCVLTYFGYGLRQNVILSDVQHCFTVHVKSFLDIISINRLF
jgi:hypothetical protein